MMKAKSGQVQPRSVQLYASTRVLKFVFLESNFSTNFKTGDLLVDFTHLKSVSIHTRVLTVCPELFVLMVDYDVVLV